MARKLDYDTVGVTFRCPKSVADKLDEICKISGIKRSQFLIQEINSTYDKIQGNPELKRILEQFKELSETMKQLENGTKSG